VILRRILMKKMKDQSDWLKRWKIQAKIDTLLEEID
jgi:hypothetical protein